MSDDIVGLRAQIMANATLLIRPTPICSGNHLPTLQSSITLVNSTDSCNHASDESGKLEVVVFGTAPKYAAALMVGLTPAIEGGTAGSVVIALHLLLRATAELLNTFIPKVGSHQRNIHGGGVFDEDMISSQLVEMQGGME